MPYIKLATDSDELRHYGIKGQQWGVRRTDAQLSKTTTGAERKAYSIGAKVNPRELSYNIRKLTNNPNADVKLLADYTLAAVKRDGILPNNQKALKAIESVGITAHAKAIYNNLDNRDLENLKTYTDSARYSRGVNGYLAIGDPRAYADEARKLKQTLSKNAVDDITVYRSCNLKFSANGVAKKFDSMDDAEVKSLFAGVSNNFSGKANKENRVFSTSTSPLFAIDTWRKVNPTAAKTYNTYMIINCKGCPGVLADGKTSNGKSLVNTRSNQEAILAPNKLTYRKLEFDEERQMFAITVDAV